MKTLVCLLMGMLGSSCALAQPAASKFTVRVLDAETGLPVTNAVVESTFELDYDPWGNRPDKVDERKETVDKNGEVTFTGNTIQRGGGGRVFADGYYWGGGGVEYTGKNIALNRWEPWNPTIEVKMRPIKNPQPLIQKRIESLKIPAWDKPLGFDMEQGDWVAPYGKGRQSDFFVNMSRRFEHSSDYDAVGTISFPNDGDGIQLYTMPEEFRNSAYKFPYEALLEGYQDRLVLERHATLRETKCSFDPKTDKYIFRVRTKKDDDGSIVSANYGCMGRIEIGWGEVFDASYWFNPDPQSRSLESNKKPY
jgi:hypothetical protein